eukprot:313582-Amphidinium_carterae.2
MLFGGKLIQLRMYTTKRMSKRNFAIQSSKLLQEASKRHFNKKTKCKTNATNSFSNNLHYQNNTDRSKTIMIESDRR